jgi:hypothetical protein
MDKFWEYLRGSINLQAVPGTSHHSIELVVHANRATVKDPPYWGGGRYVDVPKEFIL